jgi:hypothetical protein
MTVETSTTISGLNAALPAGTDPKTEGDNHMRLLKAVLQAVFNDGTTGILQLVAEHVKLGLLSTTKQGIELDDASDGVRARLSTDPTLAAANGLLELFDNTHALKRSVTMKPTMPGLPAVQALDGELLHTGNAFYAGSNAGQVDFPIGQVLLAYFASLSPVLRHQGVTVFLDSSGAGYQINGTGTTINGQWKVIGGAGITAQSVTIYLIQRWN